MTQDLLTIIIRCCDTEYFLVDILPGPHMCFTISTELLLAKNTVKNNKILEPERISRGYAVKTFAQSLRHLGNVFLYFLKEEIDVSFIKYLWLTPVFLVMVLRIMLRIYSEKEEK